MPRLRLASRVSLQDAHERSDALWRLCPMHAHAEYVATTGLGRLIFMRRDTLDFVCVRRSSERMHAPATASRAMYNACLGSPYCRESPATDRHVFLTDLKPYRAERLVRVARWERIARRGRGGRDGGGTRAIAPGTVPRPTPRLSPWAQVHAPEHADSLHLIWLGLGKDMAGSSWPSAAHGGSAPWKLAQAFSGTAPGACMERTAAWGRRHACMQACMLPACCMPRDAC